MNVITPHPMVASWADELSTAIVAEMFGEHAPQMIREKAEIEFVCSEYLQQFWDASEHKAIAEIGTKMGYDACKDDVLEYLGRNHAHHVANMYDCSIEPLVELKGRVTRHVKGLDFKKREIVIQEAKS